MQTVENPKKTFRAQVLKVKENKKKRTKKTFGTRKKTFGKIKKNRSKKTLRKHTKKTLKKRFKKKKHSQVFFATKFIILLIISGH